MLFIDNKYTKWYNKIILNARKRSSLIEGEYHHILPKSLGGNDDIENFIKLSYREHYICHLLLTRMCKSKNDIIKMCWALHKLTFSKTIYSNHQYEISRKIHIKNLKENHPSKKQSWRDKVSDIVYSHWENNLDRRQKTSNKMKETWLKNRDSIMAHLIAHNRKNAKIGAAAAKEAVSKHIEYNGKIFIGWKSLKEQTGVTRHLYNKYYVNGIDPTLRIDCNGPASKMKGESV